ncbi:hypothetical protein, partial [Burkholderia stagnalis]|uniref:hypothetical protein n=1 Tax=Burkholderia stagnalis TaxID=1503054 RepID=UPI001E345075
AATHGFQSLGKPVTHAVNTVSAPRLPTNRHLRDTNQSAHDDQLQNRLLVVLHPTPLKKEKPPELPRGGIQNA